MIIRGWDKLRYRSVFISGAGLSISSTYNTENSYVLEMDNSDNSVSFASNVTLNNVSPMLSELSISNT